jgi:hypothetical protein
VSRNTWHDAEASIEKRRGYEYHAEVADQDELFCAPVINAATDASGTLNPTVRYYIRATYVTATGETDDLHSSDASAPGPAMASVQMTGGNNAIDVEVPFHLRNSQVTQHEFIDDNTIRFKIQTPPSTVCDPDIFVGWLVYSRSPRIQDETHLGYNCDATEPLYHRHQGKPNGVLGRITNYDPATGWWTMDRGVPFGNSDHADDNTVDIMMPDRNGLPIRYYNIYISSDNRKFYHAGVGVDGTAPVRVLAHDETAPGAPSTRFPRRAPQVTAVDVTENPRDGRCGEWPVITNIEPGLHKVRVVFTSSDEKVIPPGMTEAQRLLGEPEYCWHLKDHQELHPSCATLVCVGDGQGIQVDPVEWPTDEDYDLSYDDWRIYTTELEPYAELTMEGGESVGGDLDSADDNERPYAYYYPDRDLSATDPNITALWTQMETVPPLGSGNGTADGSGASNSFYWEQFRTAPPNSRNSPEIDPFTGDYGSNTPSYQDVYPVTNQSGDPIFTFASTRDDSYANRYDFNFWMQQSPQYAQATHAVFGVRMRVQTSGTNGYFRPANADGNVFINFWDYQTASSTRMIDDIVGDDVFHTYYFCVEDPLAKSRSFDGENYLSMFVWGREGVPYDIEEVWCWLYEEGWSCGEPIHIGSSEDQAVYGNQTGGGEPDEFGAWYTGDGDQTDLHIETFVDEAYIDSDPGTAQNTPSEEYGPAHSNPAESHSRLTGAFFEDFTGTVTMGSAGPGLADVAHNWDNMPGIQYPAFSIDGYTYGVDFTFDNYTGRITSINIPDNEVITYNYELPIESWRATVEETDLVDGWLPHYPDLYKDLIDSDRVNYDSAPLWSSSRKDVVINQHHFWFRVPDEAITETPSYIRVEIRFRCREGGSGSLGAWSANTDTSRKIRLWNDVAGSWIELETGIGGPAELNEWQTRSLAIPYSDYRKTVTNFENVPGNQSYFIVAFAGLDYNGFDIDYVKLYLDPEWSDEIPTPYELRRDIIPRGTTTWTLKNPLREKPVITPSVPGPDCPDYSPMEGEWVHIRRGTTGQWPINCRAMPLVHGAGNSSEELVNYVGCADSVFVDNRDGTLDRVLHSEGEWHGRTMSQDWRFTNYLSRVFIYNPAFPKWNFRYDGVQTFPMGIGWPYTTLDDIDQQGNYDPPGPPGATPLSDDDVCGNLGEQPAGTITVSGEIDTPEGDVPEGDETNSPVLCHDIEYYIVWKRELLTAGRSYIVRSRPRLLTETVRVCLHPSQLPSVRIEAEMCPEAQVTHFEIYRNFNNTARYFLVADKKIDATMLDEDGTLGFSLEDEIPEFDSDLTQPMLLETGRPRAARIMEFHQQRNWIVSQEQGDVVDPTIISNTDGALDPEGFWPLHTIDLPMREAAAVTCLSPYESEIIAHSRTGMVALRGVSTELNDPSGISAVALYAHAGFVGPDAYCVVDSALMGLTHEGPCVVGGAEARIFATDDIDMSQFVMDAPVAYNTRCLHNRSRGISQVLFTYTDDPMRPTGHQALVFDKSSEGPNEIFWKKWDSLPAYGLTRARGRCGDEYPLMGDTMGRLFDFGFVRTDAGVFIECDIETIWFDEAEMRRSHQPDFNYWLVEGALTDKLFLDVRKDGVERHLDMAGIPIPMGGRISTTEENDPQNTRTTWGRDFNWGAGWYWREQDKGYDEQRTHHRGIMRSIQYRLYQSRELLPAGVDPGMTFLLVGFAPFHRLHAPTNANAGV